MNIRISNNRQYCRMKINTKVTLHFQHVTLTMASEEAVCNTYNGEWGSSMYHLQWRVRKQYVPLTMASEEAVCTIYNGEWGSSVYHLQWRVRKQYVPLYKVIAITWPGIQTHDLAHTRRAHWLRAIAQNTQIDGVMVMSSCIALHHPVGSSKSFQTLISNFYIFNQSQAPWVLPVVTGSNTTVPCYIPCQW